MEFRETARISSVRKHLITSKVATTIINDYNRSIQPPTQSLILTKSNTNISKPSLTTYHTQSSSLFTLRARTLVSFLAERIPMARHSIYAGDTRLPADSTKLEPRFSADESTARARARSLSLFPLIALPLVRFFHSHVMVLPRRRFFVFSSNTKVYCFIFVYCVRLEVGACA